ncbi:MAG: ABC transporter ATP-binding protein [Candidatus Heimdallarchaeaceae archaeon]
METWMVETQDLSKWYNKVIALNKITIKLKKGIIGLLGPNGAGKSTLLKLMVGLLKPSKGLIRVMGEQPWRNLKLFTRMGYCPEYDAYYSWQTGRQFINSLLKLYGYSHKEALLRTKEVVKTVGMEEFADRIIAGYSKGMKQRIKFAQAIAHDPELLVLDEPLTGADPLTRVQLIDLIRDFGKEGRAILVSSHVLHEIEKLSSRIWLLYQGKTLALGKINEIRNMIYQHPHEVKIIADNPRKLAENILSLSHITAIRFKSEQQSETLYVQTTKPAEFYRQLPKIIVETNLKVKHISSTDDTLEAVFKYLVVR